MTGPTQQIRNIALVGAGAAYTAFLLWLGDTSVFVQAVVATLPSVPLLLLIQHHDSPKNTRKASAVMSVGFLGQMLAAIYIFAMHPEGIATPVRYVLVYCVIALAGLAATRSTWAR
jgi:hypothetical protein